ncbi:MAG: hypothetical protein AAB432_00105 [Patescibacteria group bacterium]
MFTKIKNFFKFEQQISFSITAAFLCILLLVFVIYSAMFLVSHLNASLEVRSAPPQTSGFDTVGFEKLNLGK